LIDAEKIIETKVGKIQILGVDYYYDNNAKSHLENLHNLIPISGFYLNI
jgi:hypothetical protein